jgi:hypothetical protein
MSAPRAPLEYPSSTLRVTLMSRKYQRSSPRVPLSSARLGSNAQLRVRTRTQMNRTHKRTHAGPHTQARARRRAHIKTHKRTEASPHGRACACKHPLLPAERQQCNSAQQGCCNGFRCAHQSFERRQSESQRPIAPSPHCGNARGPPGLYACVCANYPLVSLRYPSCTP